jgi:hypothetical protein
MTATSTSAQGWESLGYAADGARSKFYAIPDTNTGSKLYGGQATTAVDLTAKTYLGFNATIITGAVNCNIEGITVEVLSQ